MKGNMNTKRKASDNPPMKDDVMLPHQSLRILALQLEEDAQYLDHYIKKERVVRVGERSGGVSRLDVMSPPMMRVSRFTDWLRTPPDPSPDASMDSIVTFWGKRWLRQDNNDRCRLSRGNDKEDLRVCSRYPLETVTKALTFDYNDK